MYQWTKAVFEHLFQLSLSFDIAALEAELPSCRNQVVLKVRRCI